MIYIFFRKAFPKINYGIHKELLDTKIKPLQDGSNTYCNLRIKPIYVHGQVCNSDNCNLILGTHGFDNKRTSSNQTLFLLILMY